MAGDGRKGLEMTETEHRKPVASPHSSDPQTGRFLCICEGARALAYTSDSPVTME